MEDNKRLIIKVCELYYDKNKTYTQIGKLLKVSRFKVSRLIKEGRRKGIINIVITDNYNNENLILEQQLEKTFGINMATVINNNNLPLIELRKKIGYEASKFINEILNDGDIICLTNGYTVNGIGDFIIKKKKVTDIKIVESNGESIITKFDYSCREISKKFAKIYNTAPYIINAPIIVDSKELRDNLLKQAGIKRTISLFDKVNILIFSVGNFYPKITRSIIDACDFSKQDFLELYNLKAAGNIMSYYFDINGNFLSTSFNDRLICFPKEKISNIPYTLAVVFGFEKRYALLGALRSKVIKFLIVDDILAKEVLNLSNLRKEDYDKTIENDKDFLNYINGTVTD